MIRKIILTTGISITIIGFMGCSSIGKNATAVETMARAKEPFSIVKYENIALVLKNEFKEQVTRIEAMSLSTAEEEEFIQSLNEETEVEETSNIEVEAMDTELYAIQNVNLRQGTAVTTEALRTISFGEKVKVTGITTDKQWYQVEDSEKGTGYVASSYLSETKPEQNQSEVQRESNTEQGSLPTTDTQTTTNTTQNNSGWTAEEQESLNILDELLSNQKPNEGQNSQTYEGAGHGFGSLGY